MTCYKKKYPELYCNDIYVESITEDKDGNNVSKMTRKTELYKFSPKLLEEFMAYTVNLSKHMVDLKIAVEATKQVAMVEKKKQMELDTRQKELDVIIEVERTKQKELNTRQKELDVIIEVERTKQKELDIERLKLENQLIQLKKK